MPEQSEKTMSVADMARTISEEHLVSVASPTMRLIVGEGMLGLRSDLPLEGKKFHVDYFGKGKFKDPKGRN